MTIINGHLRLETGINTLSDLLQYRRSLMDNVNTIHYLSPIPGGRTTLNFKLEQDTMLCKMFMILAKSDLYDASNSTTTSVSTSSYWYHSFSSRHPHLRHHHLPPSSQTTLSTSSTWLLPGSSPLQLPSPSSSTSSSSSSFSSLCCTQDMAPVDTLNDCERNVTPPIDNMECPERLVDTFVHRYFQCYNPTMPVLHERTFMTHYNQRRQARSRGHDQSNFVVFVEEDLLTLALCCFMSVSNCTHLGLTTEQKRIYGEYFYNRSRPLLDDMLDDPCPHRRLEALISLAMLYKFMALTLRLKEIRQLSTLGLMLAVELSKLASKDDNTFDQVEKVLVQRNTLMQSIVFGMVEYLFVQRMDDIGITKVNLQTLPDESPKTLSMVELYCSLFNMTLQPDFAVMLTQARRLAAGQMGHLSLEAMIRFETLCLDWWKNLPKKWRYCDNPYDISAIPIIEQCEEEEALATHVYILTMTVGVYSCLIHPYQSEDEQVSGLIQMRAMEMTMASCELLLAVSDRLKLISNICGFTCDYIMRVFDSLQALLLHCQKTRNDMNVELIMKNISRCFEDFCSLNPVTPFSYTESTSTLSHMESVDGKNLISVYNQYPLPGHALIYDLATSSIKKLGVSLP
ncbi:uncharacterized protein BX664DRAFT_330660 [Halteromyces radiatus]|uniref:uncharacterized protein n=1 Tax=Halteromyces radiatus TaxID=101107 RepID=UPI00221E605C|nr:uncharacterized protein BX664DRAFT_330660 [Halteromyces radiatus]KAI8093825.1 hypothetical protein BX664DRAFT_330660 [Halteromyces radiatus]